MLRLLDADPPRFAWSVPRHPGRWADFNAYITETLDSRRVTRLWREDCTVDDPLGAVACPHWSRPPATPPPPGRQRESDLFDLA